MRQTTKSVSLVMILLLSYFSAMAVYTENVEASQVTEAVQVVNGGTSSDMQAAVHSDSLKETCTSWSRNSAPVLFYALTKR